MLTQQHRRDTMLERFTWYRQSAYRWKDEDVTIYIDPWGINDPEPADAVFITHAHFDHFNMEDIEKVKADATKFFAPEDVAAELSGDVVPVKPGDEVQFGAISGTTVPAYNIVEGREGNHPKANNWVGYVLDLGGTRYYHAGDTDHVPELEAIETDVAFLPIGSAGYTMDPEEAAELAKIMRPKVAVPMHYGFVEGCEGPGGAERFAKLADPVKVEILTPTNQFEHD
jgi:L-ascorbate metabolism protein UlaG (beta-lactamase superfamily)